MFELGGSELLLIAIVALLVIGPKELPNALRTLGKYTGKARAMTRHLRAGFDEMMRQSEMEEMEKQWREHNQKIMAATPNLDASAEKPAPGEAPAATTIETPPEAATETAPQPRPLP